MSKPQIAKYKPYYYELEQDQTYFWCSCGQSKNQPFCDGSHKDTEFLPVKYQAQYAGEEVLFCGCKHTSEQPFCDGAHNNLLDIYALDDDFVSAALTRTVIRNAANPVALLNNNCYVSNPASLMLTRAGSLSWCVLINKEQGAQHQSQYFLQQPKGKSPVITFGNSEIAMLVTGGAGKINISGVTYQLSRHAGVYVKAGEAFSLENFSTEDIKIYATICPEEAGLRELDVMPDNFDSTICNRVMNIDENNNQSMGDRFFQILVGKDTGSRILTEFIGDIPKSKAAKHRHLYEETLVILEGEGAIWTENLKADVVPGDIIFLPRKQIHSLECTSEDGMRLAGVIYPGDNPAINY